MFFLSPAKLLVILVVAVIVLGPDKLPKVAHQIGGFWGEFRKLRERLESGVRDTFPDLPSTDVITQAVRSPLTFLDNLADSHSAERGETAAVPPERGPPDVEGDAVLPPTEANRPSGSVRASQGAGRLPGTPRGGAGGVIHQIRSSGHTVPDDPGMN